MAIYTQWEKGDLKEAWRVQRSIRPLRDCMAAGNPNSVVKRAAYFVGQKLGPVRAPFNISDPDLDAAIKKSVGGHRSQLMYSFGMQKLKK